MSLILRYVCAHKYLPTNDVNPANWLIHFDQINSTNSQINFISPEIVLVESRKPQQLWWNKKVSKRNAELDKTIYLRLFIDRYYYSYLWFAVRVHWFFGNWLNSKSIDNRSIAQSDKKLQHEKMLNKVDKLKNDEIFYVLDLRSYACHMMTFA